MSWHYLQEQARAGVALSTKEPQTKGRLRRSAMRSCSTCVHFPCDDEVHGKCFAHCLTSLGYHMWRPRLPAGADTFIGNKCASCVHLIKAQNPLGVECELGGVTSECDTDYKLWEQKET